MGLDEIHSLGFVHGDAAARNVLVPSDPSRSPVWIDFRSQARDVEGEITWLEARTDDRDTFISDILWNHLSCGTCETDLDSWCAKHISWYKARSSQFEIEPLEPPSYAERRKIRAAESSLRCMWIEERGEAAFVEKNVPTRQLIVTAVYDTAIDSAFES